MTTRRAFLQGTAATAAALTLGFRFAPAAAQEAETVFRPNIWLRLHRDGRAVLVLGKSEMGQGVRTVLPAILAEELDLPLDRITVEQALPGPDFRRLSTGGSTSVATLWAPLRKAGAAAREMLVAAAAQRWGAAPADCWTEPGFVVHPPSKRRLAYGALVAEAARLPVPKEPRLKDPAAFRHLGQRLPRFEGRDLVTGQATFGADLQLPGLKTAVVVRCPVLGGKVRRFQEEVALALPGVRAVVEVPTGIAVVADTAHQAFQAAQALKVEWDEGPHAAFSSKAFEADLRGRLDAKGETARAEGDAARALAGAARRVEALYTFPFQAHATLEPPMAIAQVGSDGCDLWVGSQNPNALHERAARRLGLKPEQVRVHVTLMGGGFGRRLAWDFGMEAVEVAKASGLPVKLLWTRPDDLAFDWLHPMSLQRLRGGLAADGKPVAWQHQVAAPSILLAWMEGRRSPGIVPTETNGALDIPYGIPALEVSYHEAPYHGPLGWWRAIEAVPNVFARECFVDELAAAAGKDPLAFRLDLLGPGRTVTLGQDPVDLGRLRAVLTTAAQRAGWGKPLSKGRGRGLACAHFHGTFIAEVAEVTVDARGRIRVEKVTVVTDCGRVLNPLNAEAQMEGGIVWALSALRTQVTFEQGRVQQTGYSDFPVLTFGDMPEVTCHFLPSTLDPTGLGEPPVLPLIPAVLNAVAAATGERLRTLPLPAERFA